MFSQSCRTPCDHMDCSISGFRALHQLLSLLKLMFIELMMPSNHLILCCPSPPALNPSSEYSGLLSLRMDWWDLFAVQGTLKSLPQHHSSKASILRCSGFFIVQLSHPYMTTGKTIALTTWIFVSKVMSLLFNMLSSFVIAFLPWSEHLLILWLLWGRAFQVEGRAGAKAPGQESCWV